MEYTAAYWIKKLDLQPHPEGGFYKETFKSMDFSPTKEENKYSSSLIYFLLSGNQFSSFHKLTSDEVWLYHAGCASTIYIIDEHGNLNKNKIGLNPDNKESLQVVVSANSWFAAELNDKHSYCLFSCLVTPGFKWNEFILAQKKELLIKYPEHNNLINRLTLP